MPDLATLLPPSRKLLLVGAGKMGSALLDGWLTAGLPSHQVSILEPQPSAHLASLGVHVNPSAAPHAIIVLAVKPQLIDQVAPSLASFIAPDTIVVSLMAGIKFARLQTSCVGAGAYIRTMPNTPAAIGRGITALYCDAAVENGAQQAAESLMQAVGATVWLDDEAQMDAVTALSGSGPAYVFHLVEAMAQAGEEIGLAPSVALQLARQTVAGAGAMLAAAPESAAQLRENVTSKGGTTAAGLAVLMHEQSGLTELMRHVLIAARNRSQELG
jgi:pyrroline-5-carboxylate reductase